jgi:SAM-dependent methyltransferase
MKHPDSLDDVTRNVNEMYERFPYPSPTKGKRGYSELANLLSLFSRETGMDLAGKKILDGGTGTGHRLAEAALRLKNTSFTAIDLSEASLNVAKATAAQEGINNIDFRIHNLLDDVRIGTFDVVMSMGVLHCLSDPHRGLQNLVKNLTADGIVFIYLYGKLGSRERMRRKDVVSTLLQHKVDFDRGVQMVKDLAFPLDEYGWKYDEGDDATINAMIVDAFLNVNDILYDCDDIHDLVAPSGLAAYAVYGITTQDSGWLFDTSDSPGKGMMPRMTSPAHFLKTDLLRDAYASLSIRDRYRLFDLLYQPNGYTVIGFTEQALKNLPAEHRLVRNAIPLR